jgi:hypothetical protein
VEGVRDLLVGGVAEGVEGARLDARERRPCLLPRLAHFHHLHPHTQTQIVVSLLRWPASVMLIDSRRYGGNEAQGSSGVDFGWKSATDAVSELELVGKRECGTSYHICTQHECNVGPFSPVD